VTIRPLRSRRACRSTPSSPTFSALVSLYAFNGSIESYLLLTAFDLSLGLMLIVGTTRERKDPTMVDPRSRRLVSRTMVSTEAER
jgi:hypothetical protein